jgi:hypothetical protein
MLEQAPDQNARRVLIRAMRLADVTGKAEDELVAAIEDRIARLNSPDQNLRWEEYQQFVQHKQPFGENTEFEIRPAVPPPELATWLESVTRATRLREVRALRGFTRVFPPSVGDDERIARISVNQLTWLPAVENRGEGIFIQLNQDKLRSWESKTVVVDRVTVLRKAYEQAWQDRGRPGAAPKLVTPRLLLIHSLAHALIRQVSLSCGYSSASLRERLYVDAGPMWEMAGLLIFTSSPDADGTLGGLARQGESGNIVRVFEDALASMMWCSSDPLCIEGAHTHARSRPNACLLAAETSCEEFNSFLDRGLLVGTPAQPELGFFEDYLRELRS